MTSVYQVGDGQRTVAAMAFLSSKLERHSLPAGKEALSVYMMHEWSQEAMRVYGDDREQLADACWDQVRALQLGLPVRERASLLQLTARRNAIPIHSVGRYRMSARVQQCHDKQARRHARTHGRRRHGEQATCSEPRVVVAGDYLSTATVEGALRTGMWAAESLYRGRHRGND